MRSEYISPAAFERLFDVMQYENIIAMRICLETGMRIGDVVTLKASDVNGAKIRFTAQKTGKTSVKTISNELKKRLSALMPQAADDYIFRGKNGGHRTRQAVWKDIRKACDKCGIETHVSPHSARKAYAVKIRDEQGLEAAKRELQHDKISTTMLYAFSDLVTVADGNERTNWEAVADLIADRVAARIKSLLTNDPKGDMMTEP